MTHPHVQLTKPYVKISSDIVLLLWAQSSLGLDCARSASSDIDLNQTTGHEGDVPNWNILLDDSQWEYNRGSLWLWIKFHSTNHHVPKGKRTFWAQSNHNWVEKKHKVRAVCSGVSHHACLHKRILVLCSPIFERDHAYLVGPQKKMVIFDSLVQSRTSDKNLDKDQHLKSVSGTRKAQCTSPQVIVNKRLTLQHTATANSNFKAMSLRISICWSHQVLFLFYWCVFLESERNPTCLLNHVAVPALKQKVPTPTSSKSFRLCYYLNNHVASPACGQYTNSNPLKDKSQSVRPEW